MDADGGKNALELLDPKSSAMPVLADALVGIGETVVSLINGLEREVDGLSKSAENPYFETDGAKRLWLVVKPVDATEACPEGTGAADAGAVAAEATEADTEPAREPVLETGSLMD